MRALRRAVIKWEKEDSNRASGNWIVDLQNVGLDASLIRLNKAVTYDQARVYRTPIYDSDDTEPAVRSLRRASILYNICKKNLSV